MTRYRIRGIAAPQQHSLSIGIDPHTFLVDTSLPVSLVYFSRVLVYGLLLKQPPTWSLPSDKEGLVPTMLNKWELEGVVFFWIYLVFM